MIQFAHAQAADLDRLGDEIAELAAHLDAATYRLLVMLRDFDERGGWQPGFRTCAHWLSWRTGIDLGAAREKMRVARALEALPILGSALQNGVLSYSKARALTRIATPENEAELNELALHGTAAQIERVVRTWAGVDRLEEGEQERERHERRELSLFIDYDGSYVLRGRLDPEVGAVLERALEMACEALHGQSSGPSQRRADAIGLVAELALAGGSVDSSPGAGTSGGRAERFQVVLHVDAVAMQGACDIDVATPPGAGLCEIDSGARVSAETSRRIACDAARVIMTHDARGNVLDVGRRTRVVSPSLRRALDHRDRCCRFPGCGLRHCDAHHVKHWADGGTTALDNLVLLCRFHHRLLHEEGFTIAASPDEFSFHAPDGSLVSPAPIPAPVPGDAVQSLQEEHRRVGLRIDADTGPLWRGEPLDLDLAMLMLR